MYLPHAYLSFDGFGSISRYTLGFFFRYHVVIGIVFDLVLHQSISRFIDPTLTYTSVNVSRFYKNLVKWQNKLATSVAKIFVNACTSILRRCQVFL
jgi:hypothetical protein